MGGATRYVMGTPIYCDTPKIKIMEGDQRKRSKTTRQTQRTHKPVKRRVEKERVEPPGTVQPSTAASSQSHDLQPPRTKKHVSRKPRLPTLVDTSKPVKRRVEKEGVERPGTAQPSTGASSQGHDLQPLRTKQGRKLPTLVDTSKPVKNTVVTPPESSRVTAEASKEEKYVKGTQDRSKSAQETPLKNGPRAQDGSSHASSKKTVQRKRHKRAGRYGELFSHI